MIIRVAMWAWRYVTIRFYGIFAWIAAKGRYSWRLLRLKMDQTINQFGFKRYQMKRYLMGYSQLMCCQLYFPEGQNDFFWNYKYVIRPLWKSFHIFWAKSLSPTFNIAQWSDSVTKLILWCCHWNTWTFWMLLGMKI